MSGISNRREHIGRVVKSKVTRLSWWRYRIVRLLTYIILFDLAFVFLYPFLYMIITSIKTNQDLLDSTIQWVPRQIRWQNYTIAYHALNYPTAVVNSLVYTLGGTLGHLLACSFIAYGFARYRFPGKNVLFFFLLLMIIIPPQTLIIPYYLQYSNFGWLGSYLPVLVPTLFGFGLRGGLFIFIFRQFFQGIPKEMEDVARVDGCTFIGTYFRIVVPISKSVFLVCAILSIVWHWNDFYEPSIFAAAPGMLPLSVSINGLGRIANSPAAIENLLGQIGAIDTETVINNAVFMAATFITIAPLLVLFCFVQKQFMQGIERTGLVE